MIWGFDILLPDIHPNKMKLMKTFLFLVLGLFGSGHRRSGLTRMVRSEFDEDHGNDQSIIGTERNKKAPNFGFGEIARPRMGKMMWNLLVESPPAGVYQEKRDIFSEE